MARLDRKHQKVFAGQASDNGVFGSLMAEDPTISNDIEELQSLEAWEKGWNQATMTSADLPPLEEIQGLEYVLSRQQAYIFQEGLAEWNEDTTYYKGSIVKVINGDNFVIYGSLADDNTAAVTNTSSWKVLYDSTKTYVDTVLGDSRYVTVATAQTISGNKTFSGTATFNNGVTTDTIKSSGNTITLSATNTKAVTPSSSSDSTDIATTAWTNDKLDTKQDTLTFDTTPTSGSTNPVTSGGVYTSLSGKQNSLSTTQLAAVNSGITSAKVSTYDGYATTIAGKQDTLTFDTTPTSGSTNPVTSGGVYDELCVYEQMTNGIYDGVDLTTKFASEIGSSDVWTWIYNRIQAANFTGLHIGDYIPVTISAGTVGSDSVVAQTFNCQIAGIDTHYHYADTAIGHHIDFISKEVCDTAVQWNGSNCNNGTSSIQSPWLASKVYGWLNGVNNAGTAYGSNSVGISAEGKGLYQLLPSTLRARIIQKRQLLDTRYSSSALIDYSSGWAWNDMGYLWLPNEIEVYGTQIRSNVTQQDGWWNPEANIGHTYPLWKVCQKARIKWTATGSMGSRRNWWLSSCADNFTGGACSVHSNGGANGDTAARTDIRVPLCFRIG